jgi:flagellar M-ring protein FliF
LKQITQLARAALDVDPNRGDNIEVQSVPFAQPAAEVPVKPTLAVRAVTIVQRWTSLLRYAAIALLFLVVYVFVLRPLRKQMLTTMKQIKAAVAAVPQLAGAQGALPPGTETLLPGLAGAEPELRKQIVEKVKKEPATSSKLIQSWLRQPETHK